LTLLESAGNTSVFPALEVVERRTVNLGDPIGQQQKGGCRGRVEGIAGGYHILVARNGREGLPEPLAGHPARELLEARQGVSENRLAGRRSVQHAGQKVVAFQLSHAELDEDERLAEDRDLIDARR
jgi:hypothetical protein